MKAFLTILLINLVVFNVDLKRAHKRDIFSRTAAKLFMSTAQPEQTGPATGDLGHYIDGVRLNGAKLCSNSWLKSENGKFLAGVDNEHCSINIFSYNGVEQKSIYHVNDFQGRGFSNCCYEATDQGIRMTTGSGPAWKAGDELGSGKIWVIELTDDGILNFKHKEEGQLIKYWSSADNPSAY